MRLHQNVGTLDRGIRLVVAGVLVIGLVAGFVTGPLAGLAAVLATMMAATGATGFCPLYALVGFSTRPAHA